MRFGVLAGLTAWLLVTACTSFDEPPAAPDADAGPDGTPSLDGATSSCVPEAMGSVDAGPENADCAKNGFSVDLQTSGDHCGFCGNACAPGSCDQGACKGQTLGASVEMNNFSEPPANGRIYFANSASGCLSGKVRSMALDGTDLRDELAETGGGCIDWVGIQGDRLFYVHTANGIFETSLAQPQPGGDKIVLSNDVRGVHLGPKHVAWLSGNVEILLLDRGSRSSATIHKNEDLTTIAGFVGDGEKVWWVSAPKSGPPGETLHSRAFAESSTFTRPTGLTGTRRIAVDATHVYFATDAGEIHRVRKDTPGAPELVTKIDVPFHYPRALSVVGDYVFVGVGDPDNKENAPFELYRAKRCGGRARLIARDYLLWGGIAPIGDHFYFGRIGEVARLRIVTP